MSRAALPILALAASLFCPPQWAVASEASPDSIVPARSPSPGALASLRADVGQRTIRLSTEDGLYTIRHASFDSSGVHFAGDIEGRAFWRSGEKLTPPALASPVAWERIHRIQAQRSGWLAGAVVGLLVGGALDLWSLHEMDKQDEYLGAL
jgi:hypothetical protein